MWASRRFLIGVSLIGVAMQLLSFQAARATIVPPGEYLTGGTYRGVLPCKGCIGVWTEVTLDDTGMIPGNGNGTFTMTERFTGGVHGGTTITTHGTWSTVDRTEFNTGTLKLFGKDRKGNPLAPRYFYCEHGRELTLLGNDGTRITDLTKWGTLERVIPPPQPHFRVTDSDNHTTINGRVGDTFQIDLPTTLETHAFDAWVMKQPSLHGMKLEAQTDDSILPDHPTTTFLLTAIAPGTVHVEFQRVKGPSMMVDFLFQIAPAE